MTARRVATYTVDGLPGEWLYVGQAVYEDGEVTVEHDWLRMVPVGGGDEEWVPPTDVHLVVADDAPFAVSA